MLVFAVLDSNNSFLSGPSRQHAALRPRLRSPFYFTFPYYRYLFTSSRARMTSPKCCLAVASLRHPY
jgi:hypothetical protein